MAGNINDLLNNVRDTTNPTVTTVASPRSIGASSLSCVNLDGWPDGADSAVHFITYKLDTAGRIDKTTQCDWKGLVSGTTIGSLTLQSGTDDGHTTDYFVEMAPTASWGEELVEGALAHANRDGTLKNNAVTTASITDGAVTNAKLNTTAGELGGVWTSWTPTITNVTGGTLNYAKYTKIGKTVHFRLKYTLAGAGISGSVIFDLPLEASAEYSTANSEIIGAAICSDTGSGTNPSFVVVSTATTASIRVINAAGTYGASTPVASTVPFTWGNTDFFQISGTYEAA